METEIGTGVSILGGLVLVTMIGSLVGVLAHLVRIGSGCGRAGDVLLGILGAFVSGFVFPVLGINVPCSFSGGVIVATAGATFVLMAVRLLRR